MPYEKLEGQSKFQVITNLTVNRLFPLPLQVVSYAQVTHVMFGWRED